MLYDSVTWEKGKKNIIFLLNYFFKIIFICTFKVYLRA
jgi:hypothetical protein